MLRLGLHGSCLSFCLLWAVALASCQESGFQSEAPKENIGIEAQAPVSAAATTPKAAADSLPADVTEYQPIVVEEGVIQPVCKTKLQYNPSEILCSINEAERRTIWENVTEWQPRIQSLKNPRANWISPLAAVEQVVGGQTQIFCPFVPDSDKLIFVSHFRLAEDTAVTLEAVIDDIGQVRLWKQADPGQQVYLSAKAPKVDGSVMLSKGFYTLVIDGIDTGRGATGTIATVYGANGAVLRQTEQKKEWCIFRVTAQTDVASFLRDASSCRYCMSGEELPVTP
jgi:hypothetical protein